MSDPFAPYPVIVRQAIDLRTKAKTQFSEALRQRVLELQRGAKGVRWTPYERWAWPAL